MSGVWETSGSDSLCQPQQEPVQVCVWVLVKIWTEVVMSRGQRLLQGEEHRRASSRTRPWAGWLLHAKGNCQPCGWVSGTQLPQVRGGKSGDAAGAAWAPVSVRVSDSVHPCSQLCTCVPVYVVYSCVLCAYWEKLLSLVTTCVWERGGFNPSKHYQTLLNHSIFCSLAPRLKIEENLQLNYKT